MSGRFPSLYAVLSAGVFPGSLETWARRLAEAGVQIIQYRDKRASSAELLSAARRLCLKAEPGRARDWRVCPRQGPAY